MGLSESMIEQRIHAAIRPQLDRCDELLDYYLQDAPPEVWLPIAHQFKPKTREEKAAEAIQHWMPILTKNFNRLGKAIGAALTSFGQAMSQPLDRDDLTEVGP